MQGQFHKEGSSFAWFASGVYLAAVLGYDAVTDAQAQPGAASFSFGGEEGVEEFVKVFCGNAGAVISKGGPDVSFLLLGLDDELSAAVGLGHGLFGV